MYNKCLQAWFSFIHCISQFIEYSIETIEGSFSPIYISKLHTISLKIRTLEIMPYFNIDILYRYKSDLQSLQTKITFQHLMIFTELNQLTTHKSL